jgi:hypothetical protein
MKFTATKPETRRILGLPAVRDVDALVEQSVLVPYAYDSNGRPLFDMEGLRRAADHLASRREEAPSA